MFRCLLAAAIALCSQSAFSQETPAAPVDIHVCDLEHNPRVHDGQLVRVRGDVTYAFENFGLSRPRAWRHAIFLPAVSHG